MVLLRVAALALLGNVALAQSETSSAAASSSTACSPLELVVARGTNEPGKLGVVVGDYLLNYTDAVVPGTTGYSVPYPADTSGDSVSKGVNDTIDYLASEIPRCPDQKIVLVGYSQGALVIHLALQNSGFQSGWWKQVIAIVLFGDPYNRGSDALSSVPEQGKGKVIEDCECGDPVCSQGSDFIQHVFYFKPERGYMNVTADYIKRAYDTDGNQGSQIFTSTFQGRTQACTNTTRDGPPHTTTGGGSSGNSTGGGSSSPPSSANGTSTSPPLGTGTGVPPSGGNGSTPGGSVPTYTPGPNGAGQLIPSFAAAAVFVCVFLMLAL